VPSREDILANITTGPGRPSRKDILANMTTGVDSPLISLVKGPKDAPQRTPVTTSQLVPRAEPVIIPEAPEPEPGPFEFAGPLGKFIDLIDTPRAAIVSTIKEVGDLFTGEGFSPVDWWKQTEDNLFMQDVMRDWGVDLPGPLDMVVGLGFDIAFDPITYMTGGIGAAGRAGMSANKLIDVMSKGAAWYDDIAKAGGKAGVTQAQAVHKSKVLKDGVTAVGRSNAMHSAGREALQEVGLLGQMGLFVPTTGRLGRGVRLDKVLDKATRGGMTARRARQASKLPYIGDLARPVAGKAVDDAAEAVARFGREGLEDAAAAEAKIISRMKDISKGVDLGDVPDDFYTAAARIASRMPVEAFKLPGFTGKVLTGVVPQFGKVKGNLFSTKTAETIDRSFNTKSSIKQGLRSKDYKTVLEANRVMVSNSAGWAARNRFMDLMSKDALALRRRARRLGLDPETVDDMLKTQFYLTDSLGAQVLEEGLPVINPKFRQKFGSVMSRAGDSAISDFWTQGRKWMDDALIRANMFGGTQWLAASADELWVMRRALEQVYDPTMPRALIPGGEFRGVPLVNQMDDPARRTIDEQIRAIADTEFGDGARELFDTNIWKSMDVYLSKIGEGVRRAKIMNLLEEGGIAFKDPLTWIKGQKDAAHSALKGLYGNRGDAFDEVFKGIERGLDVEQVKAMRMAIAKQQGASEVGAQTAAWVAEVEILEAKLVDIQAQLMEVMRGVSSRAQKSREALYDFMTPLLEEASLVGYRWKQLQAISSMLAQQRTAATRTIVDDKLLDDLIEKFGDVEAQMRHLVEEAKSLAEVSDNVEAMKVLLDELQVPLNELDQQGLLDAFPKDLKMREWLGEVFEFRTITERDPKGLWNRKRVVKPGFDVRQVYDDDRLFPDIGSIYRDYNGIDVAKLPRWMREADNSWQEVSAAYEGALDRGHGYGTVLTEWQQRQALAGGVLLSQDSPFVRVEATLRDGVWARNVSGGAEVAEGEPLRWSKGPSEEVFGASRRGREPKFSIPSEEELLTKYRSVTNVDEATGMTLEERQALRRREWKEWTDAGKHVGSKPRTTMPGETAMSVQVVDGERIIDVWTIEPHGSVQTFEEFGKQVTKWVRDGWVVSANGVPVRDVGVGGGVVKTLKEAKEVAQAEATKRSGRSAADRMAEIRGTGREVDRQMEAYPYRTLENEASGVALNTPRGLRVTEVRDWLVKAKRRGSISGRGPAYGYMRDGKPVQNWSQVNQDLGTDAEQFLIFGADPRGGYAGIGRLGASKEEVLAYVRGRYPEGAIGSGRPLSWPDSKPWDAAAQEKYAKKLKKYLDDLHKDLGGIEDVKNAATTKGEAVTPSVREVAAEAVTPPAAGALNEPAKTFAMPAAIREWFDSAVDFPGITVTSKGVRFTPTDLEELEALLDLWELDTGADFFLERLGRDYDIGNRRTEPTYRTDKNAKGVAYGENSDEAKIEKALKAFRDHWEPVAAKHRKSIREVAAEAVTPPAVVNRLDEIGEQLAVAKQGLSEMSPDRERALLAERDALIAELEELEGAAEAVTPPPAAAGATLRPGVKGAKGECWQCSWGKGNKMIRSMQEGGISAEDAAGRVELVHGNIPAMLDGPHAWIEYERGFKREIYVLDDTVGLNIPKDEYYATTGAEPVHRFRAMPEEGEYIFDADLFYGPPADAALTPGYVSPRAVAAEAVTPPPAAAPTPPPAAAATADVGTRINPDAVDPDGALRRSLGIPTDRPLYGPEMAQLQDLVNADAALKAARGTGRGIVTDPTPTLPAAAATRAPDPSGMYGPKGAPKFEQVIVRTPFGDFRLRFTGKRTGQKVKILDAPAALAASPAKTGPAVPGTRAPLGPGVEFKNYAAAESRIDEWAQEVFEKRWTGVDVGPEEAFPTDFAQGAVGRLLADPARQGGVRQALATLTGRTETTAFPATGLEGLSWLDQPMWEFPLDQRMAMTETERRLLTESERLTHLAYASEHYREAEAAMAAGLTLEAEIATMQGRIRQLASQTKAIQTVYDAAAPAAAAAGRAKNEVWPADVAELFDGTRSEIDDFQEALRKFNATRTRNLFNETLTQQTAAQWGPNTSNPKWSRGWIAPLSEDGGEAPLFEMLNALFKTSSSTGDFHGFLKWYDKFLNYWKAQAVSTPGFVIRNGLGGSWLSYAFGLMELGSTNKFAGVFLKASKLGEGNAVKGVDEMIKALGVSKKKSVGVGFGSRVDINELRTIRRVLDSGIVGGGQVITEVDRNVAMRLVRESRNPLTNQPIDVVFNPASAEFAPFRFIRSANEQMETVLRGALAFDVLQKGGSIGDAAGQVYKFHFNYADLTGTERKMRRVIPFWTWQKNVVPILVESLGKHPYAWGRLQQVKGNLELQSKEEGVVPDYFLENMAIRLPWKINDYQSYWIPDLPFRDLNRLMKEPGSITRVFAESAAPPVKVPLEIWAGKQFFADLPFSGRYQQVPPVYAKFPFLMKALGLAGKAKKDRKGEYKMRDQDLYMLDSWMPFLSRFRRLLPNESRYSRRVASTVVSTVFGTQVRINDPHEKRNQILRNDRAFEEKMRDLIDIEMRVR